MNQTWIMFVYDEMYFSHHVKNIYFMFFYSEKLNSIRNFSKEKDTKSISVQIFKSWHQMFNFLKNIVLVLSNTTFNDVPSYWLIYRTWICFISMTNFTQKILGFSCSWFPELIYEWNYDKTTNLWNPGEFCVIFHRHECIADLHFVFCHPGFSFLPEQSRSHSFLSVGKTVQFCIFWLCAC